MSIGMGVAFNGLWGSGVLGGSMQMHWLRDNTVVLDGEMG